MLGLIAFSFLCFLKSYSGGVKLVQREHKVKTVMRNLDREGSSSKRGRRTKNKTINFFFLKGRKGKKGVTMLYEKDPKAPVLILRRTYLMLASTMQMRKRTRTAQLVLTLSMFVIVVH